MKLRRTALSPCRCATSGVARLTGMVVIGKANASSIDADLPTRIPKAGRSSFNIETAFGVFFGFSMPVCNFNFLIGEKKLS